MRYYNIKEIQYKIYFPSFHREGYPFCFLRKGCIVDLHIRKNIPNILVDYNRS